ncbi:hypothetical protein [Synergistes jonesii]|uniref:Uncharacterized protein n=1 Tax=Synergistes jonesii TaxID=2754 RepID=A0A073IUL9_9BACT|nr:hypothetical protein [Synergistes jonesii]KEJ93166.1 hypothetical protein EH55_12735 [Synergistes jonesii]OFB60717.1 hypothetical protein JS72_12165 [Synergistes jonesii]OFB64786.1 hypothetical protein JS73_02720 [Synergistes jonesii]OFB66087.1 hypothetical protein JS79_02725 [Synergistes jonesii]OFB68946.1 hypothetical protein JS78_02725 [Synergistes jonesii]
MDKESKNIEIKTVEEKKASLGRRRWKTFLFIAAVFVCGGLFALSKMNFLGDLVYEKVIETAAEAISSDVAIGGISGNPVTGFKAEDVELSRYGERMLFVKNVGVKISWPSVVTDSPKLSLLSVEGLDASLDDLLELMPKKEKKSDEPVDVPIEKVAISDSTLRTKWGTINFKKPGVVKIRNSQDFRLDIAAVVASRDFTASGAVAKRGGSWRLDKFRLGLEGGSAELSGALYPSADMTINVASLNISDLSEILPELKGYGVRGVLSGSASFRGGGKNIASAGSGNLHDAVVKGIPISDLQTKWDLKPGHIAVEVGQGKVFDSVLSGKLTIDGASADKYMTLAADIKNFKFADWSPQFEKETKGQALFLKGGISSLSAELEGPINALKGRIDLSPSDLSYREIKLKGLSGSAVFDGRPAGDLDISATAEGKRVALKGLLSLGDKVPTDVAFSVEGYPIEKVLKCLPGADKAAASGAVSLKGTCRGLTGRWVVDAAASSAAITLQKVGALSNVNVSGSYSATDKKFTLARSSAEFNGAKLTASGTALLGESQDKLLDFKGAFRDADAKRLYQLIPALKALDIEGVASGRWSASGQLSSPVVKADFSMPSGQFRRLRLSRFNTKAEYSEGVMRLDPMKAEGCGGRGILACEIKLPKASADGRTSWKLGGKVAGVDLSIVNGLLKTSEDISGKVTGEITAGSAPGGLEWALGFDGEKVRWREFRADTLKGVIEGAPKEILIKKADGIFLNGETSVAGKIIMPPSGEPFSNAKLVLSASVSKLNVYELLRRHLPAVRSIQGLIEASADVGGTLSAPTFEGSGRIAPLRCRGFMLPMMDVKCHGSLKEIVIGDARALLHDGTVKASGRIYEENGKWLSKFSVAGENVDMKQFGAYLPQDFRARFGGTANFSMNGSGELSKLTGTGSFTAPELRIMGIEFKDVSAPFFVSQNYMMVEDLHSEMNGGKLSGGVGFDLKDNKWGGNLTVMSSDVEALVKQAAPNLKGNITGLGDLKIRGGGEIGRASTVRGGGAVKLHDGEITSFDAIETAKKYTGGKPLRFHSVQATFTYDGGDINILPGSQATAPKNDTVYSYMMLDGFISRKKELHLFSMGKVNIRALNSLMGAFGSIADAGSDIISGKVDSGELLHNVVGGVITGLTRKEFRFVTLNVGGTTEKPDFYNVKVQGTTMQTSAKESIPTSNSDPDERSLTKEGNTTFRFKFEIPVGPGNGGSAGDAAKGQVVGQTLENLLKNVDFGL